MENNGKVSISISDINWKFHKNIKNYSHPTSLVLLEYEPDNLDIKDIYTDFESDKDIEKTMLLNEGFYFLWVYKYFLNEKEDNNNNKYMKIKVLSESEIRIKNLEIEEKDNNFEVIKQIIYE